MDTNQREIIMPPLIIEKARKWARRMISDYEKGLHAASLAVSSHGAQYDEDLLKESKLAECAMSVWAGLSPLTAVRWEPGPDDDYDVVVGNCRIDVKHTSPYGSRLIWPLRKNDFFHKKQFDVLVLVKGKGAAYRVVGWLPKQKFFGDKHVATAGHKLTKGTWYVDQGKLHKMDSFLRFAKEAA